MNASLSGRVWAPGLFLVLSLVCGAARADGLEALDSFLKTARSARAAFTQTVTSPPRAQAESSQAARTRVSKGQFAFQRPGRFRFVYEPPLAQTIVADGKTLWLYDEDLDQVTARAQAGALGSTPAALIAAAGDVNTLRTEYELANESPEGGLLWVRATPRNREGQVQAVRIGLREGRQIELAALDILDSFGQRSVLRFERMEINPTLPDSTFRFTPPAGADVIRQ